MPQSGISTIPLEITLDREYASLQHWLSILLAVEAENNSVIYEGVVGVSSEIEQLPEPAHVCDFCGFEIEEEDQDCLARTMPRCRL